MATKLGGSLSADEWSEGDELSPRVTGAPGLEGERTRLYPEGLANPIPGHPGGPGFTPPIHATQPTRNPHTEGSAVPLAETAGGREWTQSPTGSNPEVGRAGREGLRTSHAATPAMGHQPSRPPPQQAAPEAEREPRSRSFVGAGVQLTDDEDKDNVRAPQQYAPRFPRAALAPNSHTGWPTPRPRCTRGSPARGMRIRMSIGTITVGLTL